MTKKATTKAQKMMKADALAERVWGVLRVDGVNGVRKGAKVWNVVTVNGSPVTIVRTAVTPEYAVRPMRDSDFVPLRTAIAALETVLGDLRLALEDARAD